jgi:hypothetical protein
MIEQIIFLLQVIGIPLAVLAVLHLPFWIFAKKKKRITRLDYAYPFVPVLFWVTFSTIFEALNIVAKSLSNLAFEIFIVMIVTLTGYIIKVFIPFPQEKQKNVILVLYLIIFIFVLLLSLFMPLLPE